MVKKYIEIPSDSFSIIPDSGSDVINIFNKITGVIQSSRSVILSYTVPAGREFYLEHIEVSSDNVSIIQVEVDAQIEAEKRLWWTDFNADFVFSAGVDKGFIIPSGKTIEVFGEHNRSSLATFSARIFGVLK